MAFTKLSLTGATRAAGTTDAPETDIWAIFRALRDARSLFGLRPGHIQTLQAMLSFLKPGHGDTVFASNSEICRRVGGVDERTLRRHIDRFVELGFMVRHDSPNRKRYRVRSSQGACISYGLSLTPLMDRAGELIAVAQEMENARRDRLFLRKQILTKLAQLEQEDPRNPYPSDIRKVLRRKLSLVEYRTLLADAEARCQEMSTAVDAPDTMQMSASDGQTARHLSRSKKERKESDRDVHEIDLQALTTVCEEAVSFSAEPLRTWEDVEQHARTLAPMIGVHPSAFEKASNAVGTRKASCAIFIILQLRNRVRDFGAYFHSITLGRREHQFQPSKLIERLSRSEPLHI